MLKKRIRASNFNGEEENILVKCILRHASIIENKRTDACTLKEKQRAWEEIGNEFNALCPNVVRQIKALKDKYTNLKTMLRKQSVEKAIQKANGGGKDIADWRPRSEAMAELAKLISNITHGTSPTLDDDEDYESHDAILPSVESDIDEKPLDLLDLQTVDVINDDNNYESDKNVTIDTTFPPKISQPSTSKSWSKYTPAFLRKQNKFKQKKLASAGFSSSRGNIENSLQSLKKKLIQRTLEMREIEHQTRLRQQQREHEARMALLEARKMDFESKVKLRQLKNPELTNTNEQCIKTEIVYE